jgi:hypothetical protein
MAQATRRRTRAPSRSGDGDGRRPEKLTELGGKSWFWVLGPGGAAIASPSWSRATRARWRAGAAEEPSR